MMAKERFNLEETLKILNFVNIHSIHTMIREPIIKIIKFIKFVSKTPQSIQKYSNLFLKLVFLAVFI